MHFIRPGMRVFLVKSSTDLCRLQPGDTGVVQSLNIASASIHIKWDNGQSWVIIPNAGDIVAPLETDMNLMQMRWFIPKLKANGLPKGFELMVKGYAGDEDYVSATPEEWDDVTDGTYDTFQIWGP